MRFGFLASIAGRVVASVPPTASATPNPTPIPVLDRPAAVVPNATPVFPTGGATFAAVGGCLGTVKPSELGSDDMVVAKDLTLDDLDMA